VQLQLIRNATMRIHYAGHLLLTDPFLGARHAYRSFSGISPNPMVDLPQPAETVVDGVEAVLVSHLHNDHFDPPAWEMLPKTIPLFCQPGDDAKIAEKGFLAVTPVEESLEWQGITIRRTPGQHGTGLLAEQMGRVSGFVLQAENEPVLYWAGDTIWYTAVEETVATVQPDLIITHSSGAKFKDSDPIVMDVAQTLALCRAAPQATVIAVHMEALDHGTVTRAALRAAAEARDISPERLLIPADGQTILPTRPRHP
jgi:L-ascorbate metabolism protein UlaG (beta-lactamase superfamily)